MDIAAQLSPAVTLPRATSSTKPATSKTVWAGRVLSSLLVLFLVVDAGCKVLLLPVVLEASAKLGFSVNAIFAIGVTLLLCTVVYVIPRTAVLGAVLLTGYLGGAVCTHVRNFEGAFPIVFSTLFGMLLWLGLGMRDTRVRALLRVAVGKVESRRV